MEQQITVQEIEARFDGEWILVGEPETSVALEVVKGTVLHQQQRSRRSLSPGRRFAPETFSPPLHGADARGHRDCSVSFPLDAQAGLVIVRAEAHGPSGSIVLRLALDTGATSTMISVGPLAAIGYDPSLVAYRVQVTTGSGVEFVPRLEISRLKALRQERSLFPILSHTQSASAGIDGLLSLDFLRGQTLAVDFRQGNVCLD